MPSSLTKLWFPCQEDQIILSCVRGVATGLSDISGGAVDWERLVERALGCRVLPRLYTSLQSDAQTPPEVLSRMQSLTIGFATHWIGLSAAGEQILSALAVAGIPAIVLKGAALAPAVYEYPAQRMVGDLDLLLPKPQLEAGADVLRELGFEPNPGEDPGADHHHLPAFYKGPRVRVELHFHVVPPPALARIPVQRLWDDACPFRLGRTDAQMLSPEHQVIHTCLHAALGHNFHGMLYQLCDLREIAHRFEVDWDSVVRDTVRFGMEVPVYFGLQAAVGLTGIEVPPEMMARLKPCGALRESLLRRLAPRVVLGPERVFGLPSWVVWDVCEKLLAEPSGRKATRQAVAVGLGHLRSGLLRRLRR